MQWFERSSSLPPELACGMHEREVAESNLTDANLVGCIDSKAMVVKADTYEQVGALVLVWVVACVCGEGMVSVIHTAALPFLH